MKEVERMGTASQLGPLGVVPEEGVRGGVSVLRQAEHGEHATAGRVECSRRSSWLVGRTAVRLQAVVHLVHRQREVEERRPSVSVARRCHTRPGRVSSQQVTYAIS